jgi:hypothetical protein
LNRQEYNVCEGQSNQGFLLLKDFKLRAVYVHAISENFIKEVVHGISRLYQAEHDKEDCKEFYDDVDGHKELKQHKFKGSNKEESEHETQFLPPIHIFKFEVGALASIEVQAVVQGGVRNQVKGKNGDKLDDNHHFVMPLLYIFFLDRDLVSLVNHDEVVHQTVKRNHTDHGRDEQDRNEWRQLLIRVAILVLAELLEHVHVTALLQPGVEAAAQDLIPAAIVLLFVNLVRNIFGVLVQLHLLHNFDEAVDV